MIPLFSLFDPQGPHSWPFVYFHGKAEAVIDREWNAAQPVCDRVAPDLIGSTVTRDSVSDGIHDVTVYGEPAKLYLWTSRMADFFCSPEEATKTTWFGKSPVYTREKPMRHGLVVLVDDEACRHEYARKVFEAKEDNI